MNDLRRSLTVNIFMEECLRGNEIMIGTLTMLYDTDLRSMLCRHNRNICVLNINVFRVYYYSAVYALHFH